MKKLYFGHWAILFILDGKIIGRMYYPVGPQGPFCCHKYNATAKQWLTY